jgi:hypothetical protein
MMATSMTSRLSILARRGRATLQADPFPHVLIDDALEPELYETLVAAFPTIETLQRKPKPIRNNHLYLRSAVEVIGNPNFSADWQSFFSHHVSTEFWLEALGLLKGELHDAHPDLEQRAGSTLEEFRVAMRRREDPFDEEIALDCQFAINSPVIKASTVRTPHLDRPNKLFNALLYCRDPGDDTPGGELILYRCLAPVLHSIGSEVMPTRIVAAKRIPYRANRLVLFLNSPTSVHGVAPRPVTRHCRKYINILCEYRERLFEVPTSTWMGRNLELARGILRRHDPHRVALPDI